MSWATKGNDEVVQAYLAKAYKESGLDPLKDAIACYGAPDDLNLNNAMDKPQTVLIIAIPPTLSDLSLPTENFSIHGDDLPSTGHSRCVSITGEKQV